MTSDPAVIPDASWWRRARTVVALCFRADRRSASLLFGLQTLANICSLASTVAIKVLIDAITRGDLGGALASAGFMAGTLGLTAFLGQRGYLRYTALVSERAGRVIDAELMRLAGTIPTIEHFERPRYLDQMTLLRSESKALAGAVNAAALNLRVFLSLAGATVIMGLLNPVLLVLPLFGVPLLFAHRWSARQAKRVREGSAQDTRARNHLYRVAASPAAGGELRLSGLIGELLSRHERVTARIERRNTRSALLGVAVTAAATVVFAAGYVGMIIVVIATGGGGTGAIGTVVLVVSLATMINTQLASAAQFGAYLQQITTAAGRLLWLEEVSRRASPRPGLAAPPSRLERGIALESAGFRYPDTERQVLRDITIQIPPGCVVALVGENGSGKSTLVKLLSGLYRPTEGAISVDGTDLTALDPAGWQRRVSPAYQDFMRLEFPVRESAGAGDLRRIGQDAPVHAALARAGAAHLAELPPDGLGTMLGTAWGGTELSGGQWQQLALARALIREESLLVVFDEPTAALDALAEKQLFGRISETVRERAAAGAVTLLVSHRFTTVTMADLIVVLSGGQIAELGDHDTLRRGGGLYQELYELQSRLYR
jgi:ATP-binding cassette, subfamily B, bacterial